jgi:hypothetical protein
MSLNAQLTLGRIDAGVLESSDVSALRDVFEQLFGDELLAKFRSIWIRAQAIREDGTLGNMTELAQEWIDLLVESEMIPDPTKRKGEPGGTGTGTGGSGGEPSEEGESGGVGDEGEENEGGMAISEELAQALADALSEAADVAEIEALGAIADEQEARDWADQVAARGKDAAEERDHKGTAAKVFGKGTGPGSGATSSRLVETRKASGPERAAAVKVAQLLERARYQERLVTDVASVLPPGRLRSRAMVQAGAERARGAMQTAEPWRAKHRKHVDDPTLQIGVMCDISGSMYAAMEPMGVLAWVFAEASRRIGAKVAQVYYGNSVFATLRPGEYQPDVRVYSAPDGTESFDQAFKALDGTLNLLHGSGARLLVISSDMYYTGPQTHAARKWIKRLTDAGVAVLIMGYGGIEYGDAYTKLGATIVDEALSPADAALAVGKAAAAAIERASARNER